MRTNLAIPVVFRAAFIDPVEDMGQLSEREIAALKSAVKAGVLETKKAGRSLIRKQVYARPGFDFEQDRFEAMCDYRVALSLDAIRRERAA